MKTAHSLCASQVTKLNAFRQRRIVTKHHREFGMHVLAEQKMVYMKAKMCLQNKGSSYQEEKNLCILNIKKTVIRKLSSL